MSADSAVHDSNSTEKPSVDHAIAFCAKALEICDALDLSPEIGARLQEVIHALEESSIGRSV